MDENADFNKIKIEMIKETMKNTQLSATQKQEKIQAINRSKSQNELVINVKSEPIKKKINNLNKSCNHYNNKKCSRFSFSCWLKKFFKLTTWAKRAASS